MEPIKLLLVLVLGAIVATMGIALYQLSTGGGNSSHLLRSLTVRIGLSVVLFVLLMAAWRLGLISPHGVEH